MKVRDIQAIVAAKMKDDWQMEIGEKAKTLANQVSSIKFACPVCSKIFATEKAARKCRDQLYDDGGLKIGDIVVVPGAYYHYHNCSLNDPWLAFKVPPNFGDYTGYRVPYYVVTALHGDETDKHRCLVTLATLCGGELQVGWNPANGDGHLAMYRIDGGKHCDANSTWLEKIQELLETCEPSTQMQEEAARLARLGISTVNLL